PDPIGTCGELLWRYERNLHVLSERIPAISDPPGTAQRPRTLASCPDGRVRLLQLLRRELDGGEATISALERGVVLGPQLPECADVFVANCAAFVEWRGSLPVTLKSAPGHARNRQAGTLKTGTRSRWKVAADHAPIRHVFQGWAHSSAWSC